MDTPKKCLSAEELGLPPSVIVVLEGLQRCQDCGKHFSPPDIYDGACTNCWHEHESERFAEMLAEQFEEYRYMTAPTGDIYSTDLLGGSWTLWDDEHCEAFAS